MDKVKRAEHGLKGIVFNVARAFLKRSNRTTGTLDARGMSTVLVLRPDKIGDMAISLPFFDGLKSRYPHLRISILASPRNVELIAEDPRFERIFLYRKNLLKDISEVQRIRREKFDCVIDMIREDSVTALFLSQLCAPGKPRIAMGKPKFREFYDFHCSPKPGNAAHIIQDTLTLLQAFGIDDEAVNGYAAPFISVSAERKATTFIEGLSGTSPDTLKIGYNVSSGSPTRVWAHEKSAALVARILKGLPSVQVILICINSDRSRAGSLAAGFASRVHVVPPDLSLLEACAVIAKLDLLISPDTSLIHVARSFRVPVVGLYSGAAWNFQAWRPFGQEGGAVISGSDDNIFDITVDQVFGSTVDLLEAQRSAAR